MKTPHIFLLLTIFLTGCSVNQKIEQAKEDIQTATTESHTQPTKNELEAVKDLCDDEQTTTAREQCEQKELERTDAEMNALLQKYQTNFQNWEAKAKDQDKVLAEKYKKGAENLQGAQKAWAAYREAQCRAEQGNTSEIGDAKIVLLGCRRRLTEQRLEELKLIYENQ